MTTDFFAGRSKTSGDERSMVVEHMVIHPNFTDYKDDLGNILQTAYSGSYLHPTKQIHEPALLKLPRPAPSSLAPLCLPPPTTDDLLGLRYLSEPNDFFLSFDFSG